MKNNQILEKNRTTADNYSLLNISISSSAATYVIASLLHCVDAAKIWRTKDIQICNYKHFDNKGFWSTFIGKNPGKQKLCGNCFKSTSSLFVIKEVSQSRGFLAPFKGIMMTQLFGLVRNLGFILPYEYSKININYFGRRNSRNFIDNEILSPLLCSIPSRIFANFFSFPIQNMRTQIINNFGNYKKVHFGINLSKGFSSSVICDVVHSGITWTCINVFNRKFQIWFDVN